MYYIGLDIGTSNIKALLTDETGAALKVSILPNILDGREYDPERLWITVVRVLRDCSAEARGGVRAIAVSAMAEAGLPLDGSLNALYGIIPWGDKRTQALLPIIRDRFPDNELYKRTGQYLQAKYTLTRLLWLKKREPEVFLKMRKWLSVGDYILYRLSGELVTDYTQACRTMLFNIENGCWDSELAEYCGVGAMLPQVSEMGRHVGYVRASVLKELGNTSKIEVRLGGHDHLVALRACEMDAGDVFDSVGTSEVFAGLTNRLNPGSEAFDSGICQGMIDGKCFYWMAGLPSSGASIEWFMRLTGLSYEDILKMSERFTKTDIMYLPYINGSGAPRVDSSVRGTLIGLDLSDSSKYVLKAIYEGISFQCAWILETLKRFGLYGGEKLCVCGGGAKNHIWQSVKADVLQKRLKLYKVNDMSAYGAALLAQGSLGRKRGYTIIEPSGDLKEYYNNKSNYFKTLAAGDKGGSA